MPTQKISMKLSRAIGVVLVGFLPTGCLKHVLPLPRSDVPMITDIGPWCSSASDAQIDDLQITVVDARLNLFNETALVRFRLSGTLAHNGFKPYVRSVQMSQRFKFDATSEPCGDIQLVPVIGFKEDKHYANERIPFDLKIERYIKTMDWGKNRYVVTAGNKTAEFVLFQAK